MSDLMQFDERRPTLPRGNENGVPGLPRAGCPLDLDPPVRLEARKQPANVTAGQSRLPGKRVRAGRALAPAVPGMIHDRQQEELGGLPEVRGQDRPVQIPGLRSRSFLTWLDVRASSAE